MDEIRTSNGSDAKVKTPATPSALPVLKKEPPEDTNTAKTENDKPATGSDPQVVPLAKPNLFSRTWLWVKRDTTSTDWLIVLLTAVIAGTSYLQWREIRSGGEDTHTLAQAAKTQAEKLGSMSDAAEKIRGAAEGMVAQEQRIADNSQRALDASNRQSKASLDASIASARVEQRAWVAATSQTDPTRGIPPVGAPFMIRTTFANTGKTPAENVRTCTMTFADRPEKSPPNNFDCPAFFPARGIIAPGGATYTDSTLTAELGREERDKILSNQIKIWVYGSISYDDVFGQHHRTNFCSEVLSGGGYNQCIKHNDID